MRQLLPMFSDQNTMLGEHSSSFDTIELNNDETCPKTFLQIQQNCLNQDITLGLPVGNQYSVDEKYCLQNQLCILCNAKYNLERETELLYNYWLYAVK